MHDERARRAQGAVRTMRAHLHLGPLRGLGLALAAVGLVACGGPSGPSEFWRPWYELPDAEPSEPATDLAGPVDARPSGPTDGGAGPGPGGCSLAISVTTTSAGGRYSPRNIGAIWISDDSDRFIKTVSVWAEKRAKYLQRWNAATSAAKVPGSRVDAVSSATKSSHGVRSGAWNCTDTTSQPVANGAYKVCFELTDYDGPGPYNCVPFTKSPAPFSLTPADSPSFTARRLELTP